MTLSLVHSRGVRIDGSLPAGKIPQGRKPVMSVSWLPIEGLKWRFHPFLCCQLMPQGCERITLGWAADTGAATKALRPLPPCPAAGYPRIDRLGGAFQV